MSSFKKRKKKKTERYTELMFRNMYSRIVDQEFQLNGKASFEIGSEAIFQWISTDQSCCELLQNIYNTSTEKLVLEPS